MPNYFIMHKDKKVAYLADNGLCEIYDEDFMPYNLYLEKNDCVNNMLNFYAWCASRVLTLDRTYAKAILNSIGATQAITDRDRAKIALSYHCLSLTDVYWVKDVSEETVCFADINLYDNHLSNTFIDISLRGRQYSVQNENLAKDVSTNGCFPKAWRRRPDGFYLLKGGDELAVISEVQASKVCECFNCPYVRYERTMFDGVLVSESKIFTDKNYSIVSREAFEIYAANRDINIKEYILSNFGYAYYMMNIIDYLVGNTDRHWGNWGFLIDNSSNEPIALHPLMDFNQSFHSYEDTEGANCMTVFGRAMTQREAAIEAVSNIGLNQIKDTDASVFNLLPEHYAIFQQRLNILKNQVSS